MLLTIRRAATGEFPLVRRFYHELTDAMSGAAFSPGWKKDIYPSPEDLRTALAHGALYLGFLGQTLCSAMVLNHACNEGYRGVCWPTPAAPEELTVLHMLGVHPRFSRRGLAKEMVGFALRSAKTAGQKAVRLDVLKGNLPAECLYAGMGFQYVATVPMFYEDTGWTDYELYEYPL